MSFKGLRKLEDKNRLISIKPVKSKFQGPITRDEKDGKKNNTNENQNIKFIGNETSPTNNVTSLPSKSQNGQGNSTGNNENNNNNNNNNMINKKDEKSSNCGRQIY